MNNDERIFDLETVLSITSNKILTDFENIYDILNYLTNDSVYTHQMPRVSQLVRPYILQKYPQLEGVGKDDIFNNEDDVKLFLNKQKGIYGNSFALKPMPKELYEHIDPIEEAIGIVSKKSK